MKCGRIVVPSDVADALAKGDMIYYMPDVAESVDSYTKFLAHFDGTTGDKPTPATTGQTITYVGDAQVSTVQKKIGSAALLLDGTGDYISIPDSADFAFGTGNFSIDTWLYFTDESNRGHTIFGHYQDASNFDAWYFEGAVNTAVFICRRGGSSRTAQWTWDYPLNTWVHVALVRKGTAAASDWMFYIDGVKQSDPSISDAGVDITDISGDIFIGANNGGELYQGYIDEYRISKGIARWTGATFTPSTTQYPNSDPGGGLTSAIVKGWKRLPIGTSGQTLKVSADGIPAWTT